MKYDKMNVEASECLSDARGVKTHRVGRAHIGVHKQTKGQLLQFARVVLYCIGVVHAIRLHISWPEGSVIMRSRKIWALFLFE